MLTRNGSLEFCVWSRHLPGRAGSSMAASLAAGRTPRIERTFFLSRPARGGHLHEDLSMSANYELRGDVAVITMDNPPVNGLGYDTRRGIVDGLDKALADPKVKAIVVTGAGKAFSGGADIREFGSPKAIAEPNLLSVIAALEA